MQLLAAHPLPSGPPLPAASSCNAMPRQTGQLGECIQGTAAGRLGRDPASLDCLQDRLHHQASAPCR